jgi:DNA polymerase
MDAELLRRYLEFYQDLGIRDLYRRVGQALPPATDLAVGQALRPANNSQTTEEPAFQPPAEPTPEADSLFKILEDIGDCHRCRLYEGRTHIVFGVGNEKSPLVFVGEGPGADEDAQGIPFVGRAGQLLTQMIENTAKKEGIELRREQVYICNVVKCRPPGNTIRRPSAKPGRTSKD